jgi:two-component system NtrC family response regulator
MARLVHQLSPRAHRPLVVVNCAAIPETLLESELFGHEKGAFTGAVQRRIGRFEQADGGTLFLDEIGELTSPVQVKLLRFLQEREFQRVGGERTLKADVRIISATHQDLEARVKEGRFREDLFYRIHVVTLKVPPLRERREDIPVLLDHFMGKYARENQKTIEGVSREARDQLMRYDYPGNVRELENIIEQAFVLCRGGILELHHLPPELRPTATTSSDTIRPLSLQSMETLMISEVLRRHQGNRRKTAENLGIDPSTLYRKLKSLRIELPPTDGRSRRK